MTPLRTISDIEAELAKYIPLTKQITGKDIQIERTQVLMDALGNPQNKLRVIHIAGTSGKTSTAYYIAGLLKSAGLKTGLTVSPHVDSIAERVQIDLMPIGEEQFAGALTEYIGIITAAGVQPTYFELVVGFAYWYFDKAGVDYAVVETGLGGLHDATNIASSPDKICVITDIGLDHMHVLGNTVAEIARQKAGIIHPDNTALMYRQDDEITKVVSDYCQQANAELKLVDEKALQAEHDDNKALGALPQYQQRNWLLARKAYEIVQARDDLVDLSPEAAEQSMQLQVPGRMEEAAVFGKTIIMDGAHNEQKTSAFVGSFGRRYPGKMVPVLISLKEGKEFAAVLPLLKPITSKLIITTFDSTQDMPARSIDPKELAEVAGHFGFDNIVVEPDQDAAYSLLVVEPGDTAVITGSFYLIGQLRSNHEELKNA